MRRTEYLITELRKSTDNTDTNGVLDAEIISYLNYGQKLIQNIIFKSNPNATFFKGVKTYDPLASGRYTLPTDIFARNAISLVETKTGIDTVNDGFRPVENIDKSEAALKFGYYIEDGELVLSGMNANYNILALRVSYFKSLPRLDKRWGKVQTVNAGVSLVLNALSYDSNLSTIDDYVTVVDKYGAQILSDIFVDTYSTNTLLTSNSLTGVTSSHYVCSGKNSVNASLLPDECETYLLDYARQRIFTRNVYNDAGKQVYFTDKQESDIASLFANNQKDILYPPITDVDMLEW